MTGPRRIVVSGASGGGKSTLLQALGAKGYATVPEPGRRIVREEAAREAAGEGGGEALPWRDPVAFAHRAIALAQADHARVARDRGAVFFDRSLVDAAAFLTHLTGEDTAPLLAAWRYDPIVFLAPPWPALFARDAERRHDFAEAEAEYERLRRTFPAAGYEVIALPRVPVAARVEFIETALRGAAASAGP